MYRMNEQWVVVCRRHLVANATTTTRRRTTQRRWASCDLVRWDCRCCCHRTRREQVAAAVRALVRGVATTCSVGAAGKRRVHASWPADRLAVLLMTMMMMMMMMSTLVSMMSNKWYSCQVKENQNFNQKNQKFTDFRFDNKLKILCNCHRIPNRAKTDGNNAPNKTWSICFSHKNRWIFFFSVKTCSKSYPNSFCCQLTC